MAAFTTHAGCETRAYAKVRDQTWITAHAARTPNGTLCGRVQHKMSPTAPDAGGWTELTDDATV